MKLSIPLWLQQRPQFSIVVMLIPLHAALLDLGSIEGKALFLTHVGLFLLWQPIVSTERKLRLRETVAGLLLAALTSWALDWWLMAAWLGGLLALFGGRMLSKRDGSVFRAAVLIYLLGQLLLWVGPQMAHATIPAPLQSITRFGLPAVLLVCTLLRHQATDAQERALDFVYSLLLFLLLAFILLGSIAYSLAWQVNYFAGLSRMVLLAGLTILVLSWLWRPHAGFQGISILFSSYLLNLGTPFEAWVSHLGALARSRSAPDDFLQQACHELMALPWLAGCRWSATECEGQLGRQTAFVADYSFPPLSLTLYSHGHISPVLLLHGKLLAQVLSEYYLAKRREQMQQMNSYTQAIHETGARLTHDIKNLLQTLRALCDIADQADTDDPQAVAALIRRQLPQISQRLEATLLKLQVPTQATAEHAPANLWFAQLQRRYQLLNMEFSSSKLRDADSLPAEAMDSIVDNLLQNALEKRNREPGIAISVRVFWQQGICLEIRDSGSEVSPATAQKLLNEPVSSQTGMGVGLYQAAQLAEEIGYRLRLEENQPGAVVFRIRQQD